MKPRLLLSLLAALAVAVAGLLLSDDSRVTKPQAATPPAAEPSTTAGTESPAPADAGAVQDVVVHDVVVRDLDGRVAWRGSVDLAPVLARIRSGERDPHRNDGGIFGNREGLLPPRERGYYREYVVRTPGLSHAGPQRVVVGRGGEVFYTSDHYESFRRIR